MIMIKELFKLDYKTSVLFSNNSPIRCNDLLYIRVRRGTIKPYTVLKLIGIDFLATETIYHLKDEYGHTCESYRENIFVYRGQNLKIQRVYDIFAQTISLLIIAAFLFLGYNPEIVWEFLLG